jgi:hypothetical protein
MFQVKALVPEMVSVKGLGLNHLFVFEPGALEPRKVVCFNGLKAEAVEPPPEVLAAALAERKAELAKLRAFRPKLALAA